MFWGAILSMSMLFTGNNLLIDNIVYIKKNVIGWSSGTLQYLGIHLAPSLKLMYTHNYPRAFTNVRSLLTQWPSYYISFLGNIQAVQNLILPKLLFFFRALSLYVPHSVIMAVQSDLLKFIWQNKKPRMSRLLMYRAQSRGGLGCPDLWTYFLASRLIIISTMASRFLLYSMVTV